MQCQYNNRYVPADDSSLYHRVQLCSYDKLDIAHRLQGFIEIFRDILITLIFAYCDTIIRIEWQKLRPMSRFLGYILRNANIDK